MLSICVMVMTFTSQSLKQALLLWNVSTSVGRGAQEGLQETVFALCHESSYRSQWVIQVWKAVRKKRKWVLLALVLLRSWLTSNAYWGLPASLVDGIDILYQAVWSCFWFYSRRFTLVNRLFLLYICELLRTTNEVLCIVGVFYLYMSKEKTKEAMDIPT